MTLLFRIVAATILGAFCTTSGIASSINRAAAFDNNLRWPPQESRSAFLQEHVIYSESGNIRLDPGQKKPEELIDAFISNPQNKTLVIHFHGGLIDVPGGESQAWEMNGNCYNEPTLHAFPIFMVWDSGWKKTLQTLITGSHLLVMKTTQNIADSLDKQSVKPGALTIDQLHVATQSARAKLQLDPELKALAASEASKNSSTVAGTQAAAISAAKQAVESANVAANVPATMPLGLKAAAFEFVTGGIARHGWDIMKGYCSSACAAPSASTPSPAGAQLIAAMKKLPPSTHVVLVGHSAGAIYMDDFLHIAQSELPNMKFDVIWLAPAISYQAVASDIATLQNTINPGHFHMFALRADVEQADHMLQEVGAIDLYPGSLLYYISGTLEHTGSDTPIVGLNRFLGDQLGPWNPILGPRRTWNSTEADSISKTITLFSLPANTTYAYPGSTASAAKYHGGFWADGPTQDSIRALIRSWQPQP